MEVVKDLFDFFVTRLPEEGLFTDKVNDVQDRSITAPSGQLHKSVKPEHHHRQSILKTEPVKRKIHTYECYLNQ